MDIDLDTGCPCPRHIVGFDLLRRPHLDADVLVIGSGIAGAAAALVAAEAGAEVLLLSKTSLQESNTHYAQGGIAAVLRDDERDDSDDLERHLADTLAAGAGLCDAAIARDILAEGSAAISFLRAQDCRFDCDQAGHAALTREGGHSARRILHADGDATGRAIVYCLRQAVLHHERVTVVENAFAIDLIGNDSVRGVIYERRGEIYAALAGRTVLATGGCGRIWRETTNPAIATGDGLAMAYRAGAQLADLEFMQFHPTTLYIAGGARLLVTEAMRGEGAVLRNHRGERFMPRHHQLAELAPRDVVSQAIVAEIRATRFPHVWLDATHLGRDFLRERFPTVTGACAQFGIDISRAWIPVHPSAHYHCGGVLADAWGRTTTPGLLAAGEVACTGLHGANRLASNSLLEGLVTGLRAGRLAAEEGGFPGRLRLRADLLPPASEAVDVPDLLRSLRAMMWRQVGIERYGNDLETATRSFRFWLDHQAHGYFPDRQGWELQNMLILGSLIGIAAQRRSASVGTHLRQDSTGPVDPRHYAWQRPADG